MPSRHFKGLTCAARFAFRNSAYVLIYTPLKIEVNDKEARCRLIILLKMEVYLNALYDSHYSSSHKQQGEAC